MAQYHSVPIAEIVTSTDPEDVLAVYGVGSCVVVCLYDPLARVGGVLHALLPGKNGKQEGAGKPTKFVDQGVPLLVDALAALGAQKQRLYAYLCGGAQVIKVNNLDKMLNIGERNVAAAQKTLQGMGLKIKGQATGGKAGSTVKLYMVNGQVTVKTLGQAERPLNGVNFYKHLN